MTYFSLSLFSEELSALTHFNIIFCLTIFSYRASLNPFSYIEVLVSFTPIIYAGEAVFVDDIPSPTNCLYGAFIYSTEPFARVKSIKFKTKEQSDGIVKVVSFRDIPQAGENVGSKTIFGTEPLFGDELTRCAGQPLAFVVIPASRISSSHLVASLPLTVNLNANLCLCHWGLSNILIKTTLIGCRFTETRRCGCKVSGGRLRSERSRATHFNC